jgi:lysophospholipase L1-like esterase
MMTSYSRLLTVGWLALASGVFAQDKPFYLKTGDRVVFYGDSITDQRLYTTLTETFIVTRFPKLPVTFIHSGWGGDRVSGGGGGPIDLRLERDVFAYQPTVMTSMLGMNDGSYRAFDQKIFDQYATGYQHIVAAVKKRVPGIRLTLIQPSPFDDVAQPPRFEGGYNAVLVRYGQFVKELASREHLDVADLNTAVVAALEKAKATDAELAKKIIPDRVHPGPAGHLLMAAELLKAWNAPAVISAVTLDAAKPTVVKTQKTRVTALQGQGNLTWKQLDEALPMPVDLSDAVMALAVKSSDFVAALNQQPLQVTGLAAGQYALKIDGNSVGEFSAGQLADGINLALLPTPMVKQAADVHKLTLKHNDLHFFRWRQIQVPVANLKDPALDAPTKNFLAALDAEEATWVKQQRQAAQPVEHKYELIKQ